MFDKETWELINSFAQWPAAIGTVGAVIVALYLARRDESIRLRVRCGIHTLLQEGNPDHGKEFLSLQITNVGRRPATVNSVGWETGWGKRQWPVKRLRLQSYYWIPPRNAYSQQLPTTLTDGQTAFLMSAVEEYKAHNIDYPMAALQGWWRWLVMRSVKVYALTSTGDVFRSRVEGSALKVFVEMANR